MNFTDVQTNLHALTCNGGVKLIGASILTGVTSFFSHEFFIYFLYFVVLVILDLFTKQISLSANYLAKKRGVEVGTISLKAKVLGVAPAFNDGAINSFYMRDKFSKKLVTYLLVVGSAFFTDCMLCGIKEDFIFFKLAVAYLAVSELLSVLENLRDCGNERLGKLIELINKKVDKVL